MPKFPQPFTIRVSSEIDIQTIYRVANSFNFKATINTLSADGSTLLALKNRTNKFTDYDLKNTICGHGLTKFLCQLAPITPGNFSLYNPFVGRYEDIHNIIHAPEHQDQQSKKVHWLNTMLGVNCLCRSNELNGYTFSNDSYL
jgi:hypothetical protein